ncbi:uncharacterized protein ColSpa_06788 [Colletotrichum spaethianum]|uniref:Uncharacterized protein n=1 Tax=Colletotrichum spaethianum TaxID=700344 RepID=A0AA37LDP8_9PEZI|nr:uncharacterized protein ColSpa_06788 [Colletotrichum spaethianum]GKT46607.1 hypothetical protein ColSpa_06788 [Colletotrichum spaethianum]
MVFDLANAEIAIAQTKFGSTAKEDIIPFASYGANTPESTGVRPSHSGSGSGGGSSADDSDDNNYGNNGYGNYSDGEYTSSLQHSVKLGIGLGVGLFCLLVMCLSIWAVRRCRRIRKAEKELSEKQADVEQVPDILASTRDGNNVAKEGSLPQQPTNAVTRDTSHPHDESN